MTSTIPICRSIPLQGQEVSPCLCPNPISIWWLAGEGTCRGITLQGQQASHSDWHQQNVFQSLEDSRSVWQDVECKLRSVNFRRVSDPGRVFRQAFRVTGISDDRYRSNWDLWWLIQEYNGSDCDKFGSTSERRRELWVHLGVSLNQHANH